MQVFFQGKVKSTIHSDYVKSNIAFASGTDWE